MNPGEHPLEEGITNSLAVKAERDVATDMRSTDAALARACGARHSEQCATMRIAGSVWTGSRPTLSAKKSLDKQTQGTDPRTGELKRGNDER